MQLKDHCPCQLYLLAAGWYTERKVGVVVVLLLRAIVAATPFRVLSLGDPTAVHKNCHTHFFRICCPLPTVCTHALATRALATRALATRALLERQM
jgi:ABC-type enterobactin transport system permease subunit